MNLRLRMKLKLFKEKVIEQAEKAKNKEIEEIKNKERIMRQEYEIEIDDLKQKLDEALKNEEMEFESKWKYLDQLEEQKKQAEKLIEELFLQISD